MGADLEYGFRVFYFVSLGVPVALESVFEYI